MGVCVRGLRGRWWKSTSQRTYQESHCRDRAGSGCCCQDRHPALGQAPHSSGSCSGPHPPCRHPTQTTVTSLLWIVGGDEVEGLRISLSRGLAAPKHSPPPVRGTQYLGRPAWHTAPPPCAARGRRPHPGTVRGWCRSGCVGSGRHRRMLSTGTMRSNRTRHPALQSVDWVCVCVCV